MMRRSALRACPAAFRIKALRPEPERSFEEKKAKFEYEERQARKAGVSIQHQSNMVADQHDANIAMEKSKLGKVVSHFDGEFTASDEDLRSWMDVKQAARLLGVTEDKLYGLREEEVREAWSREYTLAKTQREKNEIDSAAEVLMEYCTSDVGKERTLDRFAQHIIKTKKEIQSTLDKDRQGQRDRLYDALGIGQLLLSFFFVSSIVLMFRYIEKNDADLAIAKAKRSFKSAMSATNTDEPPPDYQTRYRDTPTTLDEHMKLPHPDITDPEHRELLAAREKEAEAEEERLVTLTDAVTFEADKRRREAQAQQLEDLKASIKGGSRLDLIDGVVKAMPPPSIGRLRREEAKENAYKDRKYEEREV